MKVVIAPDKFKGCLPARDVAAAMTEGARRADPNIVIDEVPMADGGEGTVEALVAATGGRLVTVRVTGPLPEMKVDATFGLPGDGRMAVIEMAAASGLHLLRPEQYDPERTTTYGTGELILAASDAGAEQVILGIGGSATVDGGLGCAQACGVRFEMSDGTVRTTETTPLSGGDVALVRKAQPSLALAVLELVNSGSIRVACDVDNPLFGPRGAAQVFGPQKGASPQQVVKLDDALKRLAQLVGAEDVASLPGAGAAGGMGFGLVRFLRARLQPGFKIVAEAVKLRERIATADLVLTGEGRLDASSLGGKTAVGVARLCKEAGVPCVALVGAIGEGADRALSEGISAYASICDRPMTLEESMLDAPRLLASAAEGVVRLFKAARGGGKTISE
jgi:glycerate kinase